MNSNCHNLLLIALFVALSSSTDAFATTSTFTLRSQSRLFAAGDEVDRELVRAKELLQQAKAQLEAMDAAEEAALSEDAANVPFFASAEAESGSAQAATKRDTVTKSKNDDGLITVDGEEMAKLSEGENWTARPLGEVFSTELDEEEDIYSAVSKQLNQRDVAASMYNLRRSMQMEDYLKIFDKRNYFIGDDV